MNIFRIYQSVGGSVKANTWLVFASSWHHCTVPTASLPVTLHTVLQQSGSSCTAWRIFSIMHPGSINNMSWCYEPLLPSWWEDRNSKFGVWPSLSILHTLPVIELNLRETQFCRGPLTTAELVQPSADTTGPVQFTALVILSAWCRITFNDSESIQCRLL